VATHDLVSLLTGARAAWPDVVLDEDVFAAHLADAAAEEGVAIGELDVPALYLTCACVRGDARALALFEREYLAALPRLVARITTDLAVIDEVRQQLRIKLLVAKGGDPPVLARYRRGSLLGWLRVVACRMAIDLLRQRGGVMVVVDEATLERRALADDPALAYLKASYRSTVSASFRAALAGLSASDRTMLRLRFVEDLPLEAIGGVYQLSKSAVSRRLARCRDALLADVIRQLRAELGVDDGELESIIQMVQSQLHLSLPRLLRTQ
jgi:RNA polymerase sigma-70 factor (ECF subfamily)